MNYKLFHTNLNVFDLERSIAFYEKTFGLKHVHTVEEDDGACVMAFLSDGTSTHILELTWYRDRKVPYDLGDNPFHIAIHSDDYEKAFRTHQEMGCYHHGDPKKGRYFISDPDGYLWEIFPPKKQ